MALENLAKVVRALHEAVMGNPSALGREHVEVVKKAVDPSHPTEPIEGKEPVDGAPTGPQGAKPPFEAMVEAAMQALLDRKDPHEAVEALLGKGEPDEADLEVAKAVEMALGMVEIEIKERTAEPAPPEGE